MADLDESDEGFGRLMAAGISAASPEAIRKARELAGEVAKVMSCDVPVVRYQCPLPSCPWVHDAPSALPVAPEGGIGEQIRASMLAAALVTEETVRAHLETHSLLEWVHEVARLREIIDLTAIALSDSGAIGALLKAAAAPGSPAAAVRRECLRRLA